MTETTTYQAGDEFDVNGTTVTLCRRKGNTGVRWNWFAHAIDLGGESYYPTPEQAIEAAHRMLQGERCSCGEPATMNASTGKTCVSCYDRHAG